MLAVITGDIINSRKEEASIWMPVLQKELQKWAGTHKEWEIYRGDSFQLELSVATVIDAVLSIIAAIKTVGVLDVRMAIGIGEKNYTGDAVITSTGTAFIRSGEAFESLKKQKLIIKTPWIELDNYSKVLFSLSTLVIDSWNSNVAGTVYLALGHPDKTQTELALLLGKEQSQVSRELKRAGYDEICQMKDFIRTEILKYAGLTT